MKTQGAKTIITLDHTAIREIIKNDPDFEIEVRGKILQSACKGTIKKVVREDFVKATTLYAEKILKEEIGEFPRFGKAFEPTKKFKDLIGDAVSRKVQGEVREHVASVLAASLEEVKAEAKRTIAETLSIKQRQYIEQVVDKALRSIAQKTLDKLTS